MRCSYFSTTRALAQMKRPVIPCIRTFKQYGQSGIPVSDILPNVAGVITRSRSGPLRAQPSRPESS